MKIIGVIPARYNSSRFPGKPLAEILGKPMIWWVYNNISRVSQLDDLFIATDDKRIFDAVEDFDGKAVMTSLEHTCGTERIAECVERLSLEDNDIVLNIQGDEPLLCAEMVMDLLKAFESPGVYMGTLKKPLNSKKEIENPNIVKVICDLNGDALYFSRSAIPYVRDKSLEYYKHIGLYGYRKWFLKKFCKMARTPLENAESLEQLRVLENGYKIRVIETGYDSIGVDTPEQLSEVEQLLRKKEWVNLF